MVVLCSATWLLAVVLISHTIDTNTNAATITSSASTLEDLQAMAEADLHDANVQRQLGHMLREHGDHSGALLVLRRVAKLAPANASDLLELGSVLGRSGQFEEAANALQVALQLQPNNAAAYMDLGITCAQQRRLEEAEVNMRTAAKFGGPEATSAALNLARLLSMSDRHSEAVHELQHAISSTADTPPLYVLSSLADSLEATSRFHEAVDVRERVARATRHGSAKANAAREALAVALRSKYGVTEDSQLDFFEAIVTQNVGVIKEAVKGTSTLLDFYDEWGMSGVAAAAISGSFRALQALLDLNVQHHQRHLLILLGEDGEHVSSIPSLLTLRIRYLLRRMRFQPSWVLGSTYIEDILEQHQSEPANASGADSPDPTVALLLSSGLANVTLTDLERASTFLLESVVTAILEHPRGIDDLGEAASVALRAMLRSVLGWRQAYLPQALLKDISFTDQLRSDVGLDLFTERLSRTNWRFGAADISQAMDPVLNRIASKLIQSGADPNYLLEDDTSGMRPLHWCALNDLPSVAQSLLVARATAESTNALQQTPLELAIAHRSKGVGDALIQHGKLAGKLDGAEDFHGLVHQRSTEALACLSDGATELASGDRTSKTCSWSGTPDQKSVPQQSCVIDQVEASSMDPSLFKEYILRRRPVLIRGAGLAAWPTAIRKWDLAYLAESAGDSNLTASCIPYAKSFGRTDDIRDVSLAGFINKEMALRETNAAGQPYYIFVPHPTGAEEPPDAWPKLWELLAKDFPGHPPSLFEKDTSGILWAGGNTQFAVGPPNSGSSPHYHTHAYNMAIFGRKKFYLYPPGQQSMSQIHPMQLRDYPEPGPAPLFCEQAPGDVIYVPLDWGHAVLNLDDSISIAREFFDVTQEAPFGSLLSIAARAR